MQNSSGSEHYNAKQSAKVDAIFAILASELPSVLVKIIVEYARHQILGEFIRSVTKANGDFPDLNTPVAVSTSGDYLAICEEEARYQIWNLKNWNCYFFGDLKSTEPSDILIHQNEVFIADRIGHILVMNLLDGKMIRKWGERGGKPGQLESPMCLTILEEEKEIYVFEDDNSRISVFNYQTGKYLRSWGQKGRKNGEFGHTRYGYAYCFMTISPSKSKNNSNSKNSSKELYISDYHNHRVQIFNPFTGKYLRTLGTSLLYHPQGIIIIGDEVFVSNSRANNCISVFSCNDAGDLLRQWGKIGSRDGEFDGPFGMAVTDDGQLIIADHYNHRIQIFS